MNIKTFGLGYSGLICQLDLQYNKLTIMSSSGIDDSSYYPAESVTIYSEESIVTLAKELLKAYNIKLAPDSRNTENA